MNQDRKQKVIRTKHMITGADHVSCYRKVLKLEHEEIRYYTLTSE